MLAWLQSNPAYAAVIFLSLTAAVSLLERKLDTYPRWQAFTRILSGLGIDVPKIVANAIALFTGQSPPPTNGGPTANGSASPTPPAPPPSAMMRAARATGIATLITLAFVLVCSCGAR